MEYTYGEARAYQDAMEQFSSPFNNLLTAEMQVQFSMDPSFGLTKKQYAWYSNDAIFDKTFFTESGPTIDIETSATGTDTARLRSAYPGQYTSHSLAVPGMGMIIPDQHIERDENNHSSLTHGEISAEIVEWDESTNSGVNALGISFESDGIYLQIRRGDSNIVFVPQKDWNIDPMDGTGPSGRVLKPENGYVYNFPFTWYNQGALFLAIYDAAVGRYFPVHHANIDGEPSLGTPNMPVQVTVENQGTADPLGCRVGGMQYTTYGTTDVRTKRINEETRYTSGGTITSTVLTDQNAIDPFAESGYPLVSFRRDETDLQSRNSLSVRLQDIIANVDQDVWLFVFDEYNPDSALTGQNFTPLVSTNGTRESRLVSDTSATAYTPSADATLRGMSYVSTGQKEVTSSGGDVASRLPLEATTVVSMALAQGSNATDAQPILINIEEGF